MPGISRAISASGSVGRPTPDCSAIQSASAGSSRRGGVRRGVRGDLKSLSEAEVTPAYFDNRISVNPRHMLFWVQAVVGGMRQAGGGAIIIFGSISWRLGLPDLVLCETARARIEGMTGWR